MLASFVQQWEPGALRAYGRKYNVTLRLIESVATVAASRRGRKLLGRRCVHLIAVVQIVSMLQNNCGANCFWGRCTGADGLYTWFFEWPISSDGRYDKLLQCSDSFFLLLHGAYCIIDGSMPIIELASEHVEWRIWLRWSIKF